LDVPATHVPVVADDVPIVTAVWNCAAFPEYAPVNDDTSDEPSAWTLMTVRLLPALYVPPLLMPLPVAPLTICAAPL